MASVNQPSQTREIQSSTGLEAPDSKGIPSKLRTRLGIYIALAGAAAVAVPTLAEAVNTAPQNAEKLNVRNSQVHGGIFTGSVWHKDRWLHAQVNLRNAGLDAKTLNVLEGKTVIAEFWGTEVNGQLKGKFKILDPCEAVFQYEFPHVDIARPIGPCSDYEPACGGEVRPPSPAKAGAKSAAKKPAASDAASAPATTKPIPAPAPVQESVELVKPHDPQTYYFLGSPENAKDTKPGQPREYEVTEKQPAEFLITGPVRIEVVAKPKDPKSKGPLKFTVKIDGEEFETAPRVLEPDGVTYKLLEKEFPEGHHEISVEPHPESAVKDLVVTIKGPKETSKPDVTAAITANAVANPNFPERIQAPGELAESWDAKSGLKTEFFQTPVVDFHTAGFQENVTRAVQAAIAKVCFTSGKLGETDSRVYCDDGVTPDQERVFGFVQTHPPIGSTDPKAPGRLAVNLTVAGNAGGQVSVSKMELEDPAGLPANMTCQAMNVALGNTNVVCFGEANGKKAVYGGKLDTRQDLLNNPHRNWLKKLLGTRDRR